MGCAPRPLIAGMLMCAALAGCAAPPAPTCACPPSAPAASSVPAPAVAPKVVAVAAPSPPVAVPVWLHDDPIGGKRPQLGHAYSGSVPLLGHDMPLPDGAWTVLVRQGTAYRQEPRTDHVALVRHDGAKLLGVIDIFGNPAFMAKKYGFPLSNVCVSKTVIVRDVRSAVAGGEQDCMTVDFRRTEVWREPAQTPFLRALAARLGEQGIALPAKLVGVQVVEANRAHAIVMEAWFNPDAAGIAPDLAEKRSQSDWASANLRKDPAHAAYVERVRVWGEAWRDVVRRVLDGLPIQTAARRVPTP